MDGLLLIDKAKGWTSHDVVAKLRGMLRSELKAKSLEPKAFLRKVKVGHTGTLDPLATGLMIVVVGSYCKRAEEFSKMDKTYEVSMKLGLTSDTGDEEGVKTKKSEHIPTENQVIEQIEQFMGVIEQTPPIYSAIKVNGKRAYELARAGKEVNLNPRKVRINKISNISYNYPIINFTCSVSSGTYIRSLVTDIGENLGTGAYMTDLRRTTVGEFDISEATTIDLLTSEAVSSKLRRA